MLSIEAVPPMKRERALRSLGENTAEAPSLLFFVVTWGTFRRQAAEDLRGYVRGQEMIDSMGCREEWNHLLP